MVNLIELLELLQDHIHYGDSDSIVEIRQACTAAISETATPELVLIALLKSQIFFIEYYFYILNLPQAPLVTTKICIKKLNSIFTQIYKKENYELSLYNTISENPFISYYEQIETEHIIESIKFYKEIAIESLKIISEFFEVHHEDVFAHLLKEVEKNDEEGEKEDRRKMYKLIKRRKNIPSHWSKHYNKNKIVLPEVIEDKIDENLL